VLRMVQELIHADPVRVARLLDEMITFPEEMEEKILELAGGLANLEAGPNTLSTE